MASAFVVEDDPVHLVDHDHPDGEMLQRIGDETAHIPLVLGCLTDDADALLQRVGGGTTRIVSRQSEGGAFPFEGDQLGIQVAVRGFETPPAPQGVSQCAAEHRRGRAEPPAAQMQPERCQQQGQPAEHKRRHQAGARRGIQQRQHQPDYQGGGNGRRYPW